MAQLEREDDHEGGALARIIGRLKKPNIQALVSILAARWQRIENVAWQLYTERTVAIAVGVQLDQLGEIVGYPRNATTGDGAEAVDAVYRQRILAKIRANRSGGTPEDIAAVFTALALPGITYEFVPGYPAGFTWRASELITPAQSSLCVRFLGWSKAAGVKALFAWQETADVGAFSTETGPGPGFDDIGAPGAGGALTGVVEAI